MQSCRGSAPARPTRASPRGARAARPRRRLRRRRPRRRAACGASCGRRSCGCCGARCSRRPRDAPASTSCWPTRGWPSPPSAPPSPVSARRPAGPQQRRLDASPSQVLGDSEWPLSEPPRASARRRVAPAAVEPRRSDSAGRRRAALAI